MRCETNRQPLCWNFMYHSRNVLSVGGSVWYMIRNLRCTVTIDSVLTNSKTQNGDSLPIYMVLSAVSVLVVAQSSSKIPEGLMSNPVLLRCTVNNTLKFALINKKINLSLQNHQNKIV